MDQETVIWLIITIAVAVIGGLAAIRLHVPAGALIGSMVAVAVMNVVFDSAFIPVSWKFFTQVSTGAYIGAKISRADVRGMKTILKPAVILAAVMIAVTAGMGILIWRVTGLSPATALFGIAPAGITDMTLASMEFDAEPSVVALLHTVRIFFTICIMPVMIKLIEKVSGVHPEPPAKAPAKAADAGGQSRKKKNAPEVAATLLVALICGWLGKKAGIPAGAIICSMIGAAAFNLISDHAYMPLRLRQFIQFFAGALIGCTVGREQVRTILRIWPAVLLSVAGFVLLDLTAAWVISKRTGMDVITALFASAPGGVTDMALIAEDMGADSAKIAAMHTLRLIGVELTFPLIISLLVNFLSK